MNLTYEVTTEGYTIFNDGKAWIVQDNYIPFPAATMEESAKLHIEDILSSFNATPTPSKEETIESLQSQIIDTQLALVEIYESMGV